MHPIPTSWNLGGRRERKKRGDGLGEGEGGGVWKEGEKRG